ncbi:hypothetical protein [Proteus sp. TJ1640]|uniref:hypothetical protein n=1 Tax=Proteus sp. TJ1640 TaxID=2050968 RepID=UPI0013A5A42E|nr:hypothetical protein [Proteus sp. TJ1640]
MNIFDEKSIKLVGWTEGEGNLISLNDYLYFDINFKKEIATETAELFELAFSSEPTKNYRFFYDLLWCFLENQIRKERYHTSTSFWILSEIIKRNKILIGHYERVFYYSDNLIENKIITPRISPDRKTLTIGFNFSGYTLDDISEKKMLKSSLDFLESSIDWIIKFIQNNPDVLNKTKYIKKTNGILVSEKELSIIYTL